MSEARNGYAEVEVGDDRLLEAVRDGDTAGYATLYERHCDAARALARQLARSRSEVDDIVSEAFARVLGVVQRGGGPKDGFRAYLLTALRHVAYDRLRGDKRHLLTDDIASFDPGEPFVDPALEGLERSLIARAFLSLPERYQAVLWHTEIEGAKPADVAPLLGLSANGVAALAYRAREKLRESYLQMHLASNAPAEACQTALTRLGAYVRGGLSKRDSAAVDRHLDKCADCRMVYAELMDVNVGLRGVVGPLIAGPGLGAYLVGLPVGAVSAGWLGGRPKRQQQAAVATAAAMLVAAAMVLTLVSHEDPLAPPTQQPPGAAPGLPDSPGPGSQPNPPPAPPPPDSPAPGNPPGSPPPGNSPDTPASAPDPPAVAASPGPAIVAPVPGVPVIPPPNSPGASTPSLPLLTAAIDPVGALSPGRSGIVAMTVENSGGTVSGDVSADIGFPSGVSLRGGPSAGSAVPMSPAAEGGDWTCSPEPEGAACIRPGLEAGEAATSYLHVDVAAEAEVDVPLGISVRSADSPQAVEAQSSRGVDPQGAPARYAATGRLRVEAVGNALLSCRERKGKRDQHDPPAPSFPMLPWLESPAVPQDAGDERMPPGDPSGLEDLLDPEAPDGEPEGPPEPSAPERDEDDAPGESEPSPGPSASPSPSEDPGSEDAEEPEESGHPSPGSCGEALQREGDRRDNDRWEMRPVDRDDDPETEMSSSARWTLPPGGEVRWAGLYFSGSGAPQDGAAAKLHAPGADSYTEVAASEVDKVELPQYHAYQAFADVTETVREYGGGEWWVADIPAESGVGRYAGWALVVVLEDPDAAHQTAIVLDAAEAVFRDPEGVRFPLAGLLPAAVPARFDIVAWEGDADLAGDAVLLDGQPLTPVGGDPGNAFASYSQGAVGPPLTFGTDVVGFEAGLGEDPEVRLVTEQDAYLAGVVALTVRNRT